MNQTPNDNQLFSIEQRLADLLVSNLSPKEFTRQLFWINYAQAEIINPDLAFVMRACAIPTQFDGDIVGVLRNDTADKIKNQKLLEDLKQYEFVHIRSEGYTYHDNTKDIVLEDWKNPDHLEEYMTLRMRIAQFYTERAKDYHESEDETRALWYLSQAIEIQSQSELHLQRSIIYADLGDYDAASKDLQVAFNEIPENPHAYFVKGYIRHYRK